ncbi:NUDIX hydrolase [Geomonas sp. RF6]|uniref:NUDIX domain-containing protein n=1 Tax=Geomonas sp. RF6 TaxID=2897342 RepID=UPI001E303A52|nr:NUDIX hydrolase [Geomonas sp. RF6]UFS69665.1 NUDIX hydrolase [Geomonas sp. RF6]
MSYDYLSCPSCGEKVRSYSNPFPTVDVLIELPEGIVLIKRRNEPFGWALPGGFVDYGESLEAAAVRECEEETALKVTQMKLLGCYSDPARDTRFHAISTVYVVKCSGTPKAGDDAAEFGVFQLDNLPSPICFDHEKILSDYRERREAGTIW